MLGLSLTKILFTIGIIIAVWRGFKMFENFRARVDATSEEEAKQTTRKSKSKPAKPGEVEMIECPRCGTFTPRGQFCTCDTPKA